MADEARIRERAHRLWEEEGRPEGRELEHWREAERQLRAEAGDSLIPVPPDHGPVDPVRNPVPVPPASDPEYPAVTGPVEMPATVSREGFNPAEVFDEAAGPASTGKPWRGRVPLRPRTGKSTLEP
jgi:hypothetical protein